MFLRKLGKRGAEMVEYAIVLACIASVGVTSYSINDGNLSGVLNGLFNNVGQVLGLANSGQVNGKQPLKYDQGSVSDLAASFLNVYADAPYSFLNNVLQTTVGSDAVLKGFGLNQYGKLNAVYYTQDNKLLALENPSIYNSTWDGNMGMSDFFTNVINENNLTRPAKEYVCATSGRDYYGPVGSDEKFTNNAQRNDFMFVAYDKYGNIVEKMDTTGLEVSNNLESATTKNTQLAFRDYINNGNPKTFNVYKYENGRGFYQYSSNVYQ